MNDMHNAMRDFSVLMPTHIPPGARLRVRRLKEALRSIAEQEFEGRCEIVIIDDSSPIPIAELLEVDPLGIQADIKIVRLRRGNGLVQALNRGLSEAKYDLIARLDDDDIWLPGKIAKQLSRFAKDPDLTIIGTGMRQNFENGSPPVDHIRPDGWSAVLRFFCEVGCPFPHGSIIARKDIFKVLGGYPQSAAVRHCEDYALWSTWIRFFKPAMIEEILFHYTVSAGSVSSIHAERNRRISRILKENFTRLGVNDNTPDAMAGLAKILGVSVLQAGVVCYRLWHYRPLSRLPTGVLEPLSALLPDRNVRTHKSGQCVATLTELLNGFGEPSVSREVNAMLIQAA